MARPTARLLPLSARSAGTVVGLVVAAAVLGLAWGSPLGRAVRTNLEDTPRPPWQAAELRDHTRPDSRILTLGCSWDPRILYYADRYGLMYNPRAHPLLSRALVDGYDYVLTCRGHRQLRALPAGVRYRRIAPALYRLDR
jgi:hypothetical protein